MLRIPPSTTHATSTPYTHTHTYNALGNLLTNTPTGTYTYSNTGYTNPHAPTAMQGTTLAYDNNGNLITKGTTSHAYDYRNNLTRTTIGSTTTTYTYNHHTRIQKGTGLATTTYPTPLYTTTGATTTISIYDLSGALLATIESDGIATTTTYTHLDHLGSLSAVTNTDGDLIQTLDYYPYGAKRIDEGTDVSQREYIGEHYDEETDLHYLNARYYEGGRGQFLSQDPVFWEVGQTQNGRAALLNPQSQNSYSYAENNPIVKKDPDGKFAFAIPLYYGAVTAPEWVPAAITGIGLAATWITADMTLRGNPGQRYIPFNQQGREVRLPGVPDPLNPWDGWKPGPPGDWKTWVGAGLSGLGLAADLYKQYQDYKQDIQQFAPKNPNGQNPSSSYNMPQSYVVQNNTTYARGSNGSLSPTSLPATVSQGGSTYYRNSSGLLSTKPGL